MKNVIRLSVVTLLLCMSLQVSAAEGLAVKVDEKSIVVEVGNSLKGATLTLEDINGVVIFKDGLMDGKSYMKALNMEELPEGVYYLHFENEYHIYTKVITKAKEGLKVEAKNSEVIFKPTFRMNDNKVRFSLTNLDEGLAKVEIYDFGGELLESISSKDAVIFRTFDFSNVPAGEYEIVIKTKKKTFRKKVNVG